MRRTGADRRIVTDHREDAEMRLVHLRNGRKTGTGIAALPMTKTEAKGLVKEILSDAKQLAAKLQELRDRLGWKALGYDSWAECVEREFGYSKRHANRLIAAQNTRDEVGPIGPTQTPGSGELPESHARELGRLPNDQRADCYQDFIDECEQAGAKPTAAGLREKVDLWLADNEPPVDTGDDDVDVGDDDQRRDDDDGDQFDDGDAGDQRDGPIWTLQADIEARRALFEDRAELTKRVIEHCRGYYNFREGTIDGRPALDVLRERLE